MSGKAAASDESEPDIGSESDVVIVNDGNNDNAERNMEPKGYVIAHRV